MELPFWTVPSVIPHPQLDRLCSGMYEFPAAVKVRFHHLSKPETALAWEVLAADLKRLLKRDVVLSDGEACIHLSLPVTRELGGVYLPEEGYTLTVDGKGVDIAAADERGLIYAVHSLVQLVGLSLFCGEGGRLEHRRILDWPHYRFRSFMPDLGRSVFTLDMLKRCVRLASRLKMNALHLHLHENEMNPVRYPGTPLGSENPFALEMEAFEELIAYGARWRVDVFPELESWGHAGSILMHHPRLYGATRPHGFGHAFGIGPGTFDLLGRMYDPWMAILPDNAMFHVGLDEANWRWLPDADPKVHNRESLVRLFYNLVRERARAHGKSVRFMMWGHPSVIPIPADLRHDIILEPYGYDLERRNPRDLLASVRPSVHDRPCVDDIRRPFVCGAGMSGTHQAGALAGTEAWAREARHMPNCLGMDLCVWGTNDIAGRLIGLFGGADFAWTPETPVNPFAHTGHREAHDSEIAMRMRIWQAFTPDADPDALRRDQGPEIVHAKYRWGEKMGQWCVPVWMPEQPVLGDCDVKPAGKTAGPDPVTQKED